MRLWAAIVLSCLFLVWVIYRLLVRKDLGKHKNELYLGLSFMGIWALIYWYFLHS